MSAQSSAYAHLDAFSWRQGDPDLSDIEAKLCDLAVLRSELDELIEATALHARAEGLTWARLGQALGVTHQAVQKRFGAKLALSAAPSTRP